MTTAENLFQKLGQCQFFSKIDLSKGYWRTPVANENIHKTVFVTGYGRFEFLRTPFGMKNSGATLVRGMRKLFHGLDHVESYIDDLIIYTNDSDAYLEVLDEFLCRLQHAHLAVRPTKCLFDSKSEELLGHLVGGNCITINEKILKEIRPAKHPTTKKERSTVALGSCQLQPRSHSIVCGNCNTVE